MDFSSRVSFWRRCDPFGKLSEDALAAIARHAQSRNWQAGSMIFQRGDTGDFLIAIGSGSLRLSLLTPQGQSLILRQAGPNEIIGELAVIDDKPRSADALVLTDISGYVLGRPDFDAIAEEHPQLLRVMMSHLVGMLRSTNDRLESLALYRLNARVARFLLGKLDEKDQLRRTGSATIRLDMAQGELALALGASRPKVNRVFQDFILLGVLVRSGQDVVCDLTKLWAQAEPEERLN